MVGPKIASVGFFQTGDNFGKVSIQWLSVLGGSFLRLVNFMRGINSSHERYKSTLPCQLLPRSRWSRPSSGIIKINSKNGLVTGANVATNFFGNVCGLFVSKRRLPFLLLLKLMLSFELSKLMWTKAYACSLVYIWFSKGDLGSLSIF